MPQSPSRYVICMFSLQRVICTPCLHAALTKSSLLYSLTSNSFALSGMQLAFAE